MRLSLLRFGYIPPDIRKKLFTTLLAVALVVATIPVGLYLVNRPQNINSRATLEIADSGQTGFLLETKKSEWNALEEIPVTIIARSEIEDINLVAAKLTFDPRKLEVLSIASSSGTPNSIEGEYFIKKWVEASFDNLTGAISVVGGVKNPGIKTNPEKKYVVATVVFKAKGVGNTEISFAEKSALYKNTDNLDISATKNNLTILITGQVVGEATPSARRTPSPQVTANLDLLSPRGGESFSYLGFVPVRWVGRNMDQISIDLYKDNAFFGRILDFLPNPNQYDWEPKNSLALPFISDGGSFQIELKGKTKSGEVLSKRSGPFIISFDGRSASSSAQVLLSEADLNKNGIVDLVDVSFLLSNYGKPGSIDLNKDGLINDLDLWVLRNSLITQRVIN